MGLFTSPAFFASSIILIIIGLGISVWDEFRPMPPYYPPRLVTGQDMIDGYYNKRGFNYQPIAKAALWIGLGGILLHLFPNPEFWLRNLVYVITRIGDGFSAIISS